MMTLREKVARALCCPGGCESGLCHGPSSWDRQADAALAAVREHLREPTAAMIEAAGDRAYFRDLDLRQAWRVMLDAALEEPER